MLATLAMLSLASPAAASDAPAKGGATVRDVGVKDGKTTPARETPAKDTAPKNTPAAAAKGSAPKGAPAKETAEGDANDGEFICLARTLYWEARTEGREGMVAVGWVVLNRKRDEEYPKTICGVVKQGNDKPGCQFSYWCDGKTDAPKPDAEWALAQQVAREMLTSPPPDPTGGALFYHATNVKAPWAGERPRTAQIGRHVYYR
jgi:spore germination cell wall hydrolase CwlJ-like protein